MAFNTLITFDTQAAAQAAVNFSDPVGTGLVATGGGNRRWTWHNGQTPSGTDTVGPTQGQGGPGDGYVYTEASSPAVANDAFFAEINQTFNAALNDIVVSFYTNQNGQTNESVWVVQTSEDGGTWTTRGPVFGGVGQQSPNGATWTKRTVDLTGLVSSANTQIRIAVQLGANGNIWHNDAGLDTIQIIGTDKAGSGGFENNAAIETQLGDNGTYTWVDVLAVAGSDIVFSNGAYIVNKEIIVRDAVLNILDETIIFNAPISTDNTGSGVINFGELVTANGKEYTRNGCNVTYARSQTKMGGYVRNDTGAVGNRRNTVREVNYYGTRVIGDCKNNRMDLFVSDCVETIFMQKDTTGNNAMFIYTQTGARMVDVINDQINNWEATGSFTEVSGCSFYECNYNILNWDSAADILLREFTSVASRTDDYWLGNGAGGSNGFRFIDSDFDFNNGRFQNAANRLYEGHSINLRIIDPDGPVAGAIVDYTGSNPGNNANTSFRETTNGTGLFGEQLLDTRSNVGNGLVNVRNHQPYVRDVRSYEHLESRATINLSRAGISQDRPEDLLLIPDPNVLTTKLVALNFSELNNATNAYSRAKAEWVDNFNFPFMMTKAGDTLTTEYDVELVQSGSPAYQFNGVKITMVTGSSFDGSIVTTGTITNNGVAVSGSLTDVTGTQVAVRVNVADAATGAPVDGARVYLQAAAGGALAAGTNIMNQEASGGTASVSVRVTGDQPVVGRVRKGSNPIYYKTTVISGIITSAGLTLDALLIRDE